MRRKDASRFIALEEELANLKRYHADLANRIAVLQEIYKKDMITLRDILTQMIKGR